MSYETNTRNGKLVALAWKQPLQEKLDVDSEESDLHALNIICDTDKNNDDFCASVWWTKMIHQTESTFTRPKENRNFLNISLLMAGLHSFLYLYKAFFIVIDFN
jgi:hypothetical protein